MAEGGESGYEADLESGGDLEDDSIQYGRAANTNTGHRQHFLYSVEDLTFGVPFRVHSDFETECADCPTAWQWEIEVFREENGSVSYKIRNQRTDRGDKEVNGAVWVRFEDGTINDGFIHRQKFTKDGIILGDEINGSFRGAVTAEEMQNLPDNELVLQIDIIVKFCHRNRKRKHESDSSNSSPTNFY